MTSRICREGSVVSIESEEREREEETNLFEVGGAEHVGEEAFASLDEHLLDSLYVSSPYERIVSLAP